MLPNGSKAMQRLGVNAFAGKVPARLYLRKPIPTKQHLSSSNYRPVSTLLGISALTRRNMRCETASRGELFLYDEDLGYAAFEAGCGTGSKAIVCMGSLTDGLLSLRYLPALATRLAALGWRVFQPVLQSSYRGWGFGSLDDDAAGVDKLLAFLEEQRGISKVVLLGSSTGCQDAVHFLKVGRRSSMVHGIILQAPVSDREALLVERQVDDPDLMQFKELAEQMIAQGRGNEPLPRKACEILGPPDVVTAYRFNSLTQRMADDDMFSSDLRDDELMEKLGHVEFSLLAGDLRR